MKKVFRGLLILFLLTACSKKFQTITTNEALKLMEEGVTVIDVRTEDEFNLSHIKNAINIPLDEIMNIDYDKDTKLIIYCASGVRSQNAINQLIDLGYTSLYNLDGGLLNWGGEIEE